MTEKILIIAAHPDDETLGCGGTIAKHAARGDEVRVMFLAEGITARYEKSELESPEIRALSARRNENAVRALAILGVVAESVLLGSRHCCRLDEYSQIEIVKEIERVLHEFSPHVVYSHSPDDVNLDHRIAHHSVLAACRPTAGLQVRALYAFEVLSSTEWNPLAPFAGNAFHDISDYMDAKIAALAAYEDEMREMPHPRSEVVVRAVASYRGAQVGVHFAEAFRLIRSLEL